MNILITGGAGYVGGFIVDLLVNEGYNVTVYDNLLYETRFLKQVHFVYGDVRDKKKLKTELDKADVVIWLSAIVGDAACALDKSLTEEINSESVKWLCENFCGKIIFMSTCSVYGMNDELMDENAPCNPLSLYAATKLRAEKHIQNRDNNFTVFRLGTLFGLGDTYSRIRLDLVVNILTQKSIIDRKMKVFGGSQWRPLLHVKDVAYAVRCAIKEKICGLFNLHAKNYQIKEIAEEIVKVAPESVIEYIDMKFEDLRDYRVSSDNFRNTTNWKPSIDLQDGILEMYNLITSGRIKNAQDPIYSCHLGLERILNERTEVN